MSLLTGLTEEQQVFLMQLARQQFPAEFRHQGSVSTALQEEEEDSDIDLEPFSDNEDDDEDSQSYHLHENSENREEGDEYDEQIRIYSLQPMLAPNSRVKKCQLNVCHEPRLRTKNLS